MTFSLIMLLSLMVIGFVVASPDNTNEYSSDFSSSPTSHPQDGSREESDEHLTWELVGELVQDFDNITAEDPEEVLRDAGDPPMISEDLCLGLFTKLEKNPKGFDDLKLDHPHNLTHVVSYSSCFRSRWNVRTVCSAAYVRYRSYRFCCQPPENTPILSRRGHFLRCRCPSYEEQ